MGLRQNLRNRYQLGIWGLIEGGEERPSAENWRWLGRRGRKVGGTLKAAFTGLA